MKMIFMQVPIAQLLLATATYYALTLGWEPHSATPAGRTVGAKLQLIADHDLQWVYFAIWIIGLGRSRLMVNANAMRAGARLDRPDQHIYRTMDKQSRGQDVPYVLMANTGSAGRFNRAQRGVFNTDESMPLLLMNTLLAGAAFGGIVMALGLLVSYGRVSRRRGCLSGRCRSAEEDSKWWKERDVHCALQSYRASSWPGHSSAPAAAALLPTALRDALAFLQRHVAVGALLHRAHEVAAENYV